MAAFFSTAIFYDKKGRAILSSHDGPNPIAVTFREYPAAVAVNRRGIKQTRKEYQERFNSDFPLAECEVKHLNGFADQPENIGGDIRPVAQLTPEEYLPYQCSNCLALHFSTDLTTFVHRAKNRPCQPQDVKSTLTAVVRY